MKKRLFIDAAALSVPRISGVGHALHGLLDTLTRERRVTDRFDIVLVTTTRGLPFLKAWGFQNVRYRVVPLPYRVWLRLPKTWLLPPMDLFFGRGVYLFPNFYSWPLLSSPSVLFIHDIGYLRFPETVQPRFRAMLNYWVPRWCRRATRVATVSMNAGEDIVQYLGVPKEKLMIVRNGIDLEHFHLRDADEVAALRKKHQLPENYILYLGNIEPRKNLVRLIQAYQALPAKQRDAHPLVLVGGSGWLGQPIEDAVSVAREAGATIVRPDGYVTDDELPALMSGATLLAHVAIHEGFGFSPLQAMACGTPVVVADNSSLPEVVGEAGVYVKATDVADITRGLSDVLSDTQLQRQLAASGLERAKQFSLSAGVAPLVDWLQDPTRVP